MSDAIQSKTMIVTVQENGIIWTENGTLIGRLCDGVAFESLPDGAGSLSARCDRLTKFAEAIAEVCEELSTDPAANLRGGAAGIANSIRKNLPLIIKGTKA